MVMMEDRIRSIELWLRLVKQQQQPLVDPNLDPVLLDPGIPSSGRNLIVTPTKYICIDGDGAFHVELAKADGVAAKHRGTIWRQTCFRIQKHWLKPGEPDPSYNPLNNHAIFPTAFEIERHAKKKPHPCFLKKDCTTGRIHLSSFQVSLASTILE
ncbi:hypothetical protein OPV22_028769 [Ensete ventricosum]|uniref:Uncharacterized protein n=1 Tax=Ensete ventricosum TaxID=4639 RepID=A0AAV8P4D8_ENSVE|nr:hypothetical protein OPV22_028769 [Ensete ventricosum]